MIYQIPGIPSNTSLASIQNILGLKKLSSDFNSLFDTQGNFLDLFILSLLSIQAKVFFLIFYYI